MITNSLRNCESRVIDTELPDRRIGTKVKPKSKDHDRHGQTGKVLRVLDGYFRKGHEAIEVKMDGFDGPWIIVPAADWCEV